MFIQCMKKVSYGKNSILGGKRGVILAMSKFFLSRFCDMKQKEYVGYNFEIVPNSLSTQIADAVCLMKCSKSMKNAEKQ